MQKSFLGFTCPDNKLIAIVDFYPEEFSDKINTMNTEIMLQMSWTNNYDILKV